ncbi:NAD(P)/FAD-dependent oxidoreductase [Streptomyces europaeiscabiei]|uniref:NAD(P)/FAD-dependent oxidoreductase n=1 Tax=Streptomyces TaxID=1883 RepID=UPI002DDA42E7|nr:NAD(P)/FAD-dependent oxidoreductase [Streptomyces sp. NBC_00481]WRY95737.1 NAD(P)/FAD-dependent oxidoreductase [Streptomyces sp. NBC_00481]
MQNGKPVVILVHPKAIERDAILTQFETWTAGSLNFVQVGSAPEALGAIEDLKENPDLGDDPNNWLMACVTVGSLGDFSGEVHVNSITENYQNVIKAIIAGSEEVSVPDGYRRLVIDADTLDRQFKGMFESWESSDPWVYLEGSRDARMARAYQDMLYRSGTRFTFNETGSPNIVVKVKGEGLGENPTAGQLYAKICQFPESERKPQQYAYDLVVVGAGPSGLAAALSAGLLELHTLVLESYVLGGTAATSINLIENYMGFPHGLSGNRLARLVLHQIKNQEIDGIDWSPLLRAHSLRREGDGRYSISLDPEGNEFASAGVVILACGQSPGRLKMEDDSDEQFQGNIHHIALRSHKERERKKDIVIVGGGDSAGEAALMFSARGEARSVTLVSRDPFRQYMNPRLMRKVNASRVVTREEYEVARFIGDDGSILKKVEIKKKNEKGEVVDTREVEASSAYILIGGTPETGWLKSSGVCRDQHDRIPTDVHLPSDVRNSFQRKYGREVCTFETNLPGVFAVGDVRSKSFRRVAQAAGQGAAVIASVEEYLRKEGGRVLSLSLSPAHRLFGPGEER